MTTGLRERKKLRTRRELSTAALDLAVRHGLAEVTVEQIADAAEVSPRTFFNYFSSKEEAVVAAGVEHARELADRLAARPADEPVTASLRVVVRESLGETAPPKEWVAQVRLVRANPALVPHQLAAHAQIEHGLRVVLAERTGLAPDDLYPALTAAAVMAAVRVATDRWLGSDEHDDLGDDIDDALDLLANGLRHPSRAP